MSALNDLRPAASDAPMHACRERRDARRSPWLLAALALACGLGAPSTALASSETPGPGWALTAHTYPTNLPPVGSATDPEGKGVIVIDVVNVGAGNRDGTVTLTDTLPPGVIATDAGELIHLGSGIAPGIGHSLWNCAIAASVVTCSNEPSGNVFDGGGGGPSGANAAGEGPHLQPQLAIAIKAAGSEESHGTNRVTIAGGGAQTPASAQNPIAVSAAPPTFGFVDWDGWFSNADGTLDTQAGSHPYALTVSFDLPTVSAVGQPSPTLVGQIRDVEVQVPPGLVGNPDVAAQCTRQQLDGALCPNDSQIGISTSVFNGGTSFKRDEVFNMVPPPGAPAEFGFSLNSISTYIDSTVRTGSDYGISTRANSVPQRKILASTITLWGDPADPSHTIWRNKQTGGCNEKEELKAEDRCKPPGNPQEAFLTLPTACSGPQTFTIRANTWEHPEVWAEAQFKSHDGNGNPVGLTGCEDLSFGPTVSTSPDTSDADTPAGLTVEVKPPLGSLQSPTGLGSSDIQNTTVTLPEGLVVNPGQAAGLQACQPAQSAIGSEAAPSCPLASKVGTVKIKSPLIEQAAEKEFEGNVFVLQSNPPELKLLVAASADGVNLKLVGTVHLDEHTGRLTTTFQGTPELPFSVFKLSFSGGPQAALDTPAQCGGYSTNADFAPWSSPFVADFLTSAAFAITAGPGGGPCPSSPMPFAPSMTAGSTTDQAGAFTDFSLLLQRGDGQQRIEKLQFKEPAGLAGLISSVPLCPEPQAAQGACPAASHIGHAVVTSGPGPYPLVIPQPGEPEAPIYLTGPYKGAPFGLSIVTPVIAGPFNLGTIVTRASIAVDPRTAQITITTDALPQIVDGVPTDLRSVNSIIDRPNFLFNPTNCNTAEFTGTATSAGGAATAPLASHFGVGSCRELAFTPKLAVSTGAKSSKAKGASLSFDISYPKGAFGTQSWFNEAKFDLPKQLPARLTTLQKACLAATFEANPAACPPASLIGHATVHTPVLPVPLAGPVYFVSYGGAKFPEAVIVLQGDGVTVDLHGETFISKAGITSATFRNTPDVPFQNIEVSIPAGPFSEFAANLTASAKGSFCGQKLVMPTLFKAQNGREVKQNTPIGVTGCPKAKQATRAQKLRAALKACHKKAKGKQAACKKNAHKQFGPLKKKSKKK